MATVGRDIVPAAFRGQGGGGAPVADAGARWRRHGSLAHLSAGRGRGGKIRRRRDPAGLCRAVCHPGGHHGPGQGGVSRGSSAFPGGVRPGRAWPDAASPSVRRGGSPARTRFRSGPRGTRFSAAGHFGPAWPWSRWTWTPTMPGRVHPRRDTCSRGLPGGAFPSDGRRFGPEHAPALGLPGSRRLGGGAQGTPRPDTPGLASTPRPGCPRSAWPGP